VHSIRRNSSRALARRQQVIVADAAGNIIGAAPALIGANSTLNDYMGPAQPLTISPKKPVSCASSWRTVLMPWRVCARLIPLRPSCHCLSDGCSPRGLGSGEFRAAVLVICTVVVLIALALAYFWQASRARDANQLCERMQPGSMRRSAGDAAVSGIGISRAGESIGRIRCMRSLA